MTKKTKAREVAEQYCKQHQDVPHLTLAKMLKAQHSLLFKDVESARTIIRTIRGKKGDEHRKKTSDKSLYVKESPYNTTQHNTTKLTHYTA